MTIKYPRGSQVTVLDGDFRPAGTGTILWIDPKQAKYTLEYHYPQTGESEEITVPETRLLPLRELKEIVPGKKNDPRRQFM